MADEGVPRRSRTIFARQDLAVDQIETTADIDALLPMRLTAWRASCRKVWLSDQPEEAGRLGSLLDSEAFLSLTKGIRPEQCELCPAPASARRSSWAETTRRATTASMIRRRRGSHPAMVQAPNAELSSSVKSAAKGTERLRHLWHGRPSCAGRRHCIRVA